MTASAAARGLRRPYRGDVRLVLGILLVCASIAGVWLVVTSARQTSPVLAATRTIVPGEVIEEADLRVVEVALGRLDEAYLSPDAIADGAVAVRTIGEGELVAASAVGESAALRTTRIVLRSAVDVPASVRAGSVVEVWAAPLVDSGDYDVPRILIADAVVVSVGGDDAAFGGAATAVELVIPRADIAAALGAMADGAAVSVVPAVGTAP